MKIKIINQQIAKEALMTQPNEAPQHDQYIDPDEKYYTVSLIDRNRMAFSHLDANKLH